MENSKWDNFVNKLGNNPTSSTPFWRRINMHKPKQNSIKTLIYENKIFHTNVEKANLFADILATTFDDKSTKLSEINELSRKIKEHEESNSEIKKLISNTELDKAIKELNNKKSSGLDGICNLVLKKLPQNFKTLLLKLFNKTLLESKIPINWKLSEVTIIPKKNSELDNPNHTDQ